MRCVECGTDNPDRARFCLNCGARLAAKCRRCAAELPPQAKFCLECGARVDSAPSGLPPAPLAEDASASATADWAAAALRRLVPREYAERLLSAGGEAGSERRVATILFSDVKGYSTLAEHLDPEDTLDIMNGAFECLIAPVFRHEGTLARMMGDAILAFFGAPFSHEDDPERAVRAALEIQAGIHEYAAKLAAERGIPGFNVRVGINTGLVVTGEVGSDLHVEYTAVGDAINMAARMEQNAPPGAILITEDTYRLVRHAFDVQPQPLLTVKGHSESMQTYLVLQARPQAYDASSRGVEGIEVPMIGRDAELAQLQAIFEEVKEVSELRMITLLGDAGVGKSRLLHEFERWQERQPARTITFKGRAMPMSQLSPYGLVRDLFARRFNILESDGTELAREKFERGMKSSWSGEQDATEAAHFVGHLFGFDFGDSRYLRQASNDPRQLHDRARSYLATFFRTVTAQAPVIVFLEDLHWSDDSSLDGLNQLALALAHCPLLFLCAARPSLLERRPHWGEGQAYHSRLDLKPLSQQATRRLVAEILQKVDPVPNALRDLVVTGAEGNPFFAEELIKMLIEDRVILKGANTDDAWRVDLDRFTATHVPTTLVGVLQARLDHLTPKERSVLQQASVVGRQFWDEAVAQISRLEASEAGVAPALSALRTKEMVFERETSDFEGAREYIFKHALLREVTYESLLKRLRRAYHSVVADWLIERGERVGELAGLIGEHLEQAGRMAEAADYFGQAAATAAAKFANEEAIRYYRRALVLYGQAAPRIGGVEASHQHLLRLHEGLGDVYELRSQKSEAGSAYSEALAVTPEFESIARARLQRKLANLVPISEVDQRLERLASAQDGLGAAPASGDPDRWHEWLEIQSARMWANYWGQRFEAIEQIAVEVRPLLDAHGTLGQRSEFFRCLANASIIRNRTVCTGESIEYIRTALSYDREAGNLRIIGLDHFQLGFHLLSRGDLSEAEVELRRSLELAEQVGDAWLQTVALTYLTIRFRRGDQVDEARTFAARSLKSAETARLDTYIVTAKGNLAWLAWRDGDMANAEALGQAARALFQAAPGPFRWVALWPLAAIALAREQFTAAAGLAREMLHPSQQRLPDPLAELLEAAIRAATDDEQEAAAHLRQAVALARQMHYL